MSVFRKIFKYSRYGQGYRIVHIDDFIYGIFSSKIFTRILFRQCRCVWFRQKSFGISNDEGKGKKIEKVGVSINQFIFPKKFFFFILDHRNENIFIKPLPVMFK